MAMKIFGKHKRTCPYCGYTAESHFEFAVIDWMWDHIAVFHHDQAARDLEEAMRRD